MHKQFFQMTVSLDFYGIFASFSYLRQFACIRVSFLCFWFLSLVVEYQSNLLPYLLNGLFTCPERS